MYALNNDEKAYLRKIMINVRNEYIKKEMYKEYEEIEIENEDDLNLSNYACYKDSIDVLIENINDNDILPSNIENLFTNKKIMKIVKALTLKEKLVLFLYYFESKTDREIGENLDIKTNTIKKIRLRALEKIRLSYFNNGGRKNV